jgi:DNA-binding beta-propeller fold protein YncE
VLALSASAVLAASAQASDQIFWANFVSNKISHANLDGSGGVVDLNTTGATASEPIGLAIDPVGGRVYWTNHTGGKIAWANLDGSGGGDLATGSATVSGPTSPAIDVAARRIYWLNEGNDTVSWAALDGSGGGDLDIGGAPIDLPGALAVDPAGGRLYWTNWGFIGDGYRPGRRQAVLGERQPGHRLLGEPGRKRCVRRRRSRTRNQGPLRARGRPGSRKAVSGQHGGI